MPGGLMNLVSTGKENVILNNNPKKSFFKAVYLKYTNFGMQKFRIDFTGQKTLKINDPSYFSFKIPRHGDLLMDTYLVVNLPNIWSPLYNTTIPYKFQWIRNIGTEMIEEIEISSGGQTLQKYSGTYINFIAHRDYSHSKREVFNDMTGNIPELYDPANINNNGFYPNTKYNPDYTREPSIRGRTLYIPITTWFSYNSQQAVPLVALQYSEININIKFRPVKEIFTILNITGDPVDNDTDTRIQSNQNETYHQFHRFLVSPPKDQDSYTDTRSDWNSDIHLIANYAFLSEEERNVFTQKPQKYLIKEVYQTIFYDIASSAILNMASSSLVASWMFALRRSDVKKYNEWTNYTNWKYINKPPILTDIDDIDSPIKQTGNFNDENIKEILLTAGISVDGKYRENVLDRGLFKFCSVFSQSQGSFSSLPFVYNYNFCLNTSPFTLQPSGSMNLSSHKNVELEITTHTPPFDEVGTFEISCDPDSGAIIGIKKPPNSVYEYTYDLILFEERWNIINFTNGLCGLQFAR